MMRFESSMSKKNLLGDTIASNKKLLGETMASSPAVKAPVIQKQKKDVSTASKMKKLEKK